jgi:hypothetical protein
MKKQGSVVTDPVVRAIDRASQAEYRLEALLARVEEAIKQDRDRIRLACPLEGGLYKMSRILLRYLQQEQAKEPEWASIALGEVLALINVSRLARSIWPELSHRGEREMQTSGVQRRKKER